MTAEPTADAVTTSAFPEASPSLDVIALTRPITPGTVQDRLERLLLDDQELLISLRCQLEQIRREIRLLNDDRIVRALADGTAPLRH